ncbi:MAG: nitrous oxide reductase accessory protein NosL [Geminicoccaceae bacterium]
MKWLFRCLAPLGLLLAACGPDEIAEAPPPQTEIGEVQSYFCAMSLVEHDGPKAQLYLPDREEALWFASIRDLFTYLQFPDVQGRMRGAYVTDLAALGADGAVPARAWIDARDAYYVLDSAYSGGMGLSEAVPFAERAAAEAFMADQGGRLARFNDIDADWVFAFGDDANGERS